VLHRIRRAVAAKLQSTENPTVDPTVNPARDPTRDPTSNLTLSPINDKNKKFM